jgi:CRP-like cAMP-binding protein
MKENFANILEEIPEIEGKLQESLQKNFSYLQDREQVKFAEQMYS